MKKSILIVLIGKRKESAVNVQKVLTGWGCFIKTRLGIHDGVLENCSNQGLLFLELVGDEEKHEELKRKLELLKGISVKLIEMEIEDSEFEK